MNYSEEYKRKLITADQAAKLVKSGNWVNMGEFVQHPWDCDTALARRKDELRDVKIRATTLPVVPEVCKVDPERKHFIVNDWHFSGVSRKLMDQNLCSYIPFTYHEAAMLYENFLEVDVCFQPVAPWIRTDF